MKGSFEDHYSGHADEYAKRRPRYPDELFSWLVSVSPGHELAWDAGTGNGQVAAALAERMDRVIATDASLEQLLRAPRHSRVEYRHEPADCASLAAQSADLITAGAAAHWFELDGFYREVRRVGKKGAVLALFSYGPRDIADAIDPIVHRFQEEVLESFWPERIKYVHDRYASLPFPFEEMEAPSFTMNAEWTLRDLLDFLETWSASRRYFQERGTLATDLIAPELERVWGETGSRRSFSYPLFLRAGRL